MTYTTIYIKNLFTDQPITFDEVPEETMIFFEKQKELIRSGQAPMLGTVESLTRSRELSFFPAYQELLKIFFKNGYTDELMSQILHEFGVPRNYAEKLLEDENFVSQLKPWFEGITCDGSRAAITLGIIYDTVKDCFTLQKSRPTEIL